MTQLTAQGYAIALGGLVVFPIALAMLLWSWPGVLLGRPPAIPVDDSVTPMLLSRLGIALLGLWILAYGCIDLVYIETEMWLLHDHLGPAYSENPTQLAGRVTNIVQIAIGLGFWLKRRSLAALAMGARAPSIGDDT